MTYNIATTTYNANIVGLYGIHISVFGWKVKTPGILTLIPKNICTLETQYDCNVENCITFGQMATIVAL